MLPCGVEVCLELYLFNGAWLICGFCSVSTLLRHPSLVQFTPYVEECLQLLSTSVHALPSDKLLCCLIGLQRIAEEVAIIFNMDESGANVAFTEPKTQYHLKNFDRRLRSWRQSAQQAAHPRLHFLVCVSACRANR